MRNILRRRFLCFFSRWIKQTRKIVISAIARRRRRRELELHSSVKIVCAAAEGAFRISRRKFLDKTVPGQCISQRLRGHF